MISLRRAILPTARTGLRWKGTTTQEVSLKESRDKAAKRAAYYKKNLQSQLESYRCPGWEDALPFEKIPGPKPLPILGNTFRFLPIIGEFHNVPVVRFHEIMVERYGDIFILKGIPGREPVVFTTNNKDMETLLRSTDILPIRIGMDSLVHFQKQDKLVFKELKGLLSVQGEEWYKLRNQVNPILMQPSVMRQYVTKVDAVCTQFVENMKYFASKNENNEMPDDFQIELFKWALEMVSVIAIDKRMGLLELDGDENSEAKQCMRNVLDIFDLFFHLEIMPPVWKYVGTPKYYQFMKKLNAVLVFLKKQIDECLSKPVDPSLPESEWSVVHRLAKNDKNVAYVMAMDMMVAGVDTTGKAMASILYFLAKNPDKQALLREEIMQILPDKNGTLTVDSLHDIPYTRACIKEGLRIAPIALGNSRVTVKDLVMCGYQIPKGVNVITLNMMSANDESNFKNPDQFLPERWLRTTKDEFSYKNAHPFSYMPFGHGSRSCVGRRLANLEMELIIIRIIRNLELSWNKPDPEFIGYFLYGIDSPLNYCVKTIDY